MFVNPMRDRSNSGEGDNPFKDISQRVADMWSNIRTRTLSGNVSDLPPGTVSCFLILSIFSHVYSFLIFLEVKSGSLI